LKTLILPFTRSRIETVTNLSCLREDPESEAGEKEYFSRKISRPFPKPSGTWPPISKVTNHQTKKVLLLVSAEPNQGKSMITFHLACSLAELGKEVVVVDCDTRMPSLHSYFHLPNQVGLKDVLEQKASLEDALQKSSFEGVQVLTSGSQLAHPSQMLSSAQMTKLVKSLSQQFDYVLLDSPAMLAVADVAALAPNASGLMLWLCDRPMRKERLCRRQAIPGRAKR
jgi:capsular exopolysaccharide synthesis family protein